MTDVVEMNGKTVQLDMSREDDLTRSAMNTLKERYLTAEETSVQQAFARAALAFSDNEEHAQRLYDYASKFWFMYSTPVLSNGGTSKGQSISCFLSHVADSRKGLSAHYDENIWLSSNGGGIGGYWGDVRSNGESTSRGGESTGIIPFIKVVDSQMLAFNQGVSRRGAYAAYLNVDHPEIEEFIVMRKPSGGDVNRKTLNLHNAVNITNDFMRAVKNNGPWALVDPHSHRVTKTVQARDLWISILETRMATGEPYLCFIDIINDALPESFKEKGLKVKHSNLCVAPDTEILTKEGYREIFSYVGKEVEVWNGKEWSMVTPQKTSSQSSLLRVSFSNGSYLECTPEHEFYVYDQTSGEVVLKSCEELIIGDILEKWDVPDTNKYESISISVTMIEDLGSLSPTYCFTEPKRHRGMFNGVVTGQCSEITLPSDEDRTAVCCLSSVNLDKYDEWKDDPLFIEDLVRMLDNVLEQFIQTAPEGMERAINSASRERSIGLGAMGFHSFLQSNGVPFESAMALAWTNKIHKDIKDKAVLASQKLAIERGVPVDAPEGMRHSHLIAIAPNASSSIICNTSPSIEPWSGNAFTQKTKSGSFLVKNKHLEDVLEGLDMNIPEIWSNIITNHGSVQHLDISEDIKEVYKTAFELDQQWIVEHASHRQKQICQSQSVNLFFEAGTSKKEFHNVHFLAWEMGLKSLYYCRTRAVKRAETVATKVERKVVDEYVDGTTCFSCEG